MCKFFMMAAVVVTVFALDNDAEAARGGHSGSRGGSRAHAGRNHGRHSHYRHGHHDRYRYGHRYDRRWYGSYAYGSYYRPRHVYGSVGYQPVCESCETEPEPVCESCAPTPEPVCDTCEQTAYVPGEETAVPGYGSVYGGYGNRFYGHRYDGYRHGRYGHGHNRHRQHASRHHGGRGGRSHGRG
jgi:hypothetical protein